ncbi:MAG: sodium:solute symporter family protein [Planctomycetales bacterium]
MQAPDLLIDTVSRLPLLAQQGEMEASLKELGNLPIYVLGGYLVLLLLLGLLGWAKSKTGEEDYYLAGRGQGWIVSSVTIMATFFSSYALLGAPGMVYREGVMFALFSLNVPVAGVCVYLLGSRIWKVGRRFGYVTPGDMVADYYGSRVALKVLVALTSLFYVLPYVIMQINAGGIVAKELALFDTWTVLDSWGLGLIDAERRSFVIGSIVLAAITMIYIMVGGMRSVAWTDLVQGAMLIAGMLIAGFAMFHLFGGVGGFGRAVSEGLPDSSLTLPGTTGEWQWTLLFTVCVLGSSGSMVQPAQWMRFYSAKSVQTLKRGAVIFAAVLTTCFILGVMLIGLAGQVLYPLTYTLSQPIPDGPADVALPDEFGAVEGQAKYRVEYRPPTDATANGLVSWSWKGREGRAMSIEDKAALLSASDDPAWRTAVEALHAKTLASNEDEGTRAAFTAHPDVVGGPDSILVKIITTRLKVLWGAIGAVIASLIIVAIMAAAMSTADSNLHALSAVATRDIYDSFLHPQASERERVWVGRSIIVAATVMALFVVIVASQPEMRARYNILGMIAMMGLLAIGFSAQLLPIVIDMCFLQRGSRVGAAVGLAAGLLGTFFFSTLFKMLVEGLGNPAGPKALLEHINTIKTALPMHESVWGLALNIPLFCWISLFTQKPAVEKVREYRETFASKIGPA